MQRDACEEWNVNYRVQKRRYRDGVELVSAEKYIYVVNEHKIILRRHKFHYTESVRVQYTLCDSAHILLILYSQ